MDELARQRVEADEDDDDLDARPPVGATKKI
jgi:hypothetical protein